MVVVVSKDRVTPLTTASPLGTGGTTVLVSITGR